MVAEAGRIRRRGKSRPSHRWHALRRAVPALCAAIALWLLDRPALALVAGSLGLALVIVSLAMPKLGRSVDDTTERLGRLAGAVVAAALGAVGWLVGILPVWVAARALRRSPLSDGWTTSATSAFTEIESRRHRSPLGTPVRPFGTGFRDTRRPGARPSGVVALVAVSGAALAMVLGNALLDRGTDGSASVLTEPDSGAAVTTDAFRGSLAVRPPVPTVVPPPLGDGPISYAGIPVDDYAHEHEPWARELFHELDSAAHQPDWFLGSRMLDFDGRHLNIRDRRRVSYQPNATPEFTVWFFGGSTMYGIGQRDDGTIPSVVARLAEADGIPIAAVNFGVSAHNNWQATEAFEQALTSDLARPDLVVFYDGANELALASHRADIGDADASHISRTPLSDDERSAEEAQVVASPSPEIDWDELRIGLGATQYSRGVRTAQLLADAVNVTARHFWQPIAADKAPTEADDRLYERIEMKREWLPLESAAYQAIRAQSDVDPIDLSRVFDDLTQPVFFDFAHTNELGASVVASAMYTHLKPDLLDLRRGDE